MRHLDSDARYLTVGVLKVASMHLAPHRCEKNFTHPPEKSIHTCVGRVAMNFKNSFFTKKN